MGKLSHKIPEKKDHFENFRYWQLNLRFCKTGKRSWKVIKFEAQKSANSAVEKNDIVLERWVAIIKVEEN